MPGTLVEMGLKLLPALGSHMSTWLGPPSSQTRMHDLAVAFASTSMPASAKMLLACRYRLRLMPNRLRAPVRMNSRRFSSDSVQVRQPILSPGLGTLMGKFPSEKRGGAISNRPLSCQSCLLARTSRPRRRG